MRLCDGLFQLLLLLCSVGCRLFQDQPSVLGRRSQVDKSQKETPTQTRVFRFPGLSSRRFLGNLDPCCSDSANIPFSQDSPRRISALRCQSSSWFPLIKLSLCQPWKVSQVHLPLCQPSKCSPAPFLTLSEWPSHVRTPDANAAQS